MYIISSAITSARDEKDAQLFLTGSLLTGSFLTGWALIGTLQTLGVPGTQLNHVDHRLAFAACGQFLQTDLLTFLLRRRGVHSKSSLQGLEIFFSMIVTANQASRTHISSPLV